MSELKKNKSIFICKRYKELLDDGTYDYSYDWLGALIVVAKGELIPFKEWNLLASLNDTYIQDD